jgi:hypothetical protein
MKFSIIATLVVLSALWVVLPARAKEQSVCFRDDFDTLDKWKPFYFSTIEQHTSYVLYAEDGEGCLKAASNASASALVYRETFNVYEYPMLTWRWKIENVYKKGNARTKEGDDYPLRIYVLFEYNLQEAGFFEMLRYKTAELLYGEHPPHSCLSYIWANKNHEQRVITNRFSKRSKLIVMKAGDVHTGSWHTESVNIIEDYQRAFNATPPATACIGIMNDSDNTGESSFSYLDYIEVYRDKKR